MDDEFSIDVGTIGDNTEDNEAVKIYCRNAISNLADNTTIPLNDNRVLFGLCGEMLGYIDNANDDEKPRLRIIARAIYECVTNYGMYVENQITQ